MRPLVFVVGLGVLSGFVPTVAALYSTCQLATAEWNGDTRVRFLDPDDTYRSDYDGYKRTAAPAAVVGLVAGEGVQLTIGMPGGPPLYQCVRVCAKQITVLEPRVECSVPAGTQHIVVSIQDADTPAPYALYVDLP